MSTILLIYILLVIILVLHLIEEVKHGFHKKLPVGEIPKWLFISLNVLIYIFCAVILILLIQDNPSVKILLWIFGIGMLLNGLGHIGMMITRRSYFPGGITAIPLLLLTIYFLVLLG
ncbi:MAG: HXXEE domain-containing protein [candidate division Zixibacteria bacterium]|nr:HXXEE domain-containing protein [candidate division Zixibacteria bacterium]